MTKRKRLFIAICSPLLLIFAFAAWLPFAPIAHAQEPEGECIPITDTLFNLYSFTNEVREDTWVAEDQSAWGPGVPIDNALGISDTIKASMYASASLWRRWAFSLQHVVSGTININSEYNLHANVWEIKLAVHPDLNADAAAAGWISLPISSWDGSYTGRIGSIAFRNIGKVTGGGYAYLDAADITVTGCYYAPVFTATCPTLNDYHFTLTDTWSLAGSASILSSTLTLNPTGSASQTLSTTLQMSTTYNAVLSVTNAVSAPVVVELAGMSQTLTIDAAGMYTATFTTTGAISSPGYLIHHEGESETYTDVDWTCVYEGSAITSTTPMACIAPFNGEYVSLDGWDWHRGAAWNMAEENAYLPFNQGGDDERALVITTGVYSLPALAAGEYLILTFGAAAGGGQEAIVASRVLSSWHEFNISGGEVYTYEHDISAMSGQSATVAFVNAGNDGSAAATDCQFPAQDSVLVDNVCIYVSTSPAADPPAASTGLCPADLGFDWGCADVEALLLGYGINVQGLDDVYATGVSVWDVENYIPWLVAALWHNVGHPISCFIVEFMRLAVGLVEYEVNIFANYVNWVYSLIYAGPAWLQTGFFYLTGVDTKIYQGQAAEGGWWNWLGNSLRAVFYNDGLNGQTTARYVANVPTQITGPLREERNTVTGYINTIMTDLMGIWNNSIISYFYATSSGRANAAIPAADPSNPTDPWTAPLELLTYLLQFVGSIFNMAWSLLSWLVNTFFAGANVPVDAYHSFVAGVDSEAAEIDVQCVDDNFWCYFWAGVQLINQTASQSVIYPFVIIGLILATIVIVWMNLYELFHVDIG